MFLNRWAAKLFLFCLKSISQLLLLTNVSKINQKVHFNSTKCVKETKITFKRCIMGRQNDNVHLRWAAVLPTLRTTALEHKLISISFENNFPLSFPLSFSPTPLFFDLLSRSDFRRKNQGCQLAFQNAKFFWNFWLEIKWLVLAIQTVFGLLWMPKKTVPL